MEAKSSDSVYFEEEKCPPCVLKREKVTIEAMVDTISPSLDEDFENSVCSVCKNKRPNVGHEKDFTYAELYKGTNGFSPENFLSEGGFGFHYKGFLDNGLTVAVKDVSFQGEKEFKSEVSVLSRARQPNLVRLLGSCSEGSHRLLVYEFVCNGLLDQHLLKNATSPLDWGKRIKVAVEADKGLEDLHRNNIIHRDMRLNNILVTHDHEWMLGDFGLARTQYDDSDHSTKMRVLGTLGYVAPEYAEYGKLSTKSEVYSFGVVLLQLITGLKIREDKFEGKSRVGWVRRTNTVSYSSSSKGKKKSGDGKNQQDHYALLGLGHLRYLATEEQIRKSYCETALKYHPDKQAAILLGVENEAANLIKKDEIENRFRAIQEAYEALMDPMRRRIFDSTDEFDDEIHTDCAPQDFFKVFGPAFMRNGRWSITQPVPSLGEDGTAYKEVDDFYDFWYSFKSWREFRSEEDFDLEQAESRDHKRWMERQNSKHSKKARKEEYARVRNLVDNAYKRDPRVLRRKEQEKAERKIKKQAKYLAKKLEEEEAARVAEEERLRKEEEEKQAAAAATLNRKKSKEKEKKLLRKERTRLRTLSAPVLPQHLLGLSEDDVESLCISLDIDNLRNLCNNMDGKEAPDQAQLLKDALSGKKSDRVDDGRRMI